ASHAGPVHALVSQLDIERFESDLAFERWLAKSRLRCGVLFHNSRAIVRLLRATPAPLTWFSGHVHRRGAFFMDKASGAVGALAQPLSDGGDRVEFLQVPALGLHGNRPHDESEYLLAVLRAGRLMRYRYCNLRGGGLDSSASSQVGES